MIIKKFQGKTEKDAIVAAREELGNRAVIMNIRTTRPGGIMKLFRKPMVEVTAALEEKDDIKIPVKKAQEAAEKSEIPEKAEYAPEEMEQRLSSIQSLLEKQMHKEEAEAEAEEPEEETLEEKEGIPFLRMIYKQLIDNAVEEECANQIISEVEKSIRKDMTLDSVLAAVYQKIILKLGEPRNIQYEENKKKIYFFVGPTGVGKTTTIAKLASELKLNQHAKLALMTSDTYRIAAVEQLRIYANILGLPLHVIYEPEDLQKNLNQLKEYDTIFVDTAGRSHKNEEHCNELEELLHSMPEECEYEKEVFLVLSITTKYSDLERICTKYRGMCNYRIIFTKLDETTGIGNILNVAMLEDGRISYVTSGQNVPDDIGAIDVQKVAKQLLGGVE